MHQPWRAGTSLGTRQSSDYVLPTRDREQHDPSQMKATELVSLLLGTQTRKQSSLQACGWKIAILSPGKDSREVCAGEKRS